MPSPLPPPGREVHRYLDVGVGNGDAAQIGADCVVSGRERIMLLHDRFLHDARLEPLIEAGDIRVALFLNVERLWQKLRSLDDVFPRSEGRNRLLAMR